MNKSNPSKFYQELKRIGACPGETMELFTVDKHEKEDLSDFDAAERIAIKFSAISKELPLMKIMNFQLE